MKRKCRFLSLVLTLALMASVTIGAGPSRAAYDYKFAQTKASNTSVSFSWSSDHAVDIYVNLKLEKKNVTAKSYTLTQAGMTAGRSYSVVLVKTGSPIGDGSTYTVRTKPAAITMKQTTYYPAGNVSVLNWAPVVTMCDGYQVRLDAASGNDGGSGYATDGKAESFKVTLKKNLFYKVRTRGYLQLKHKHAFGAWSAMRYVALMPDTKFEKAPGASIKVSWTKVAGASKYVISVGKKDDGSDAVVSATVSSKETTATLTSMGSTPIEKNGSSYYVFIKPYIKVSGKEHASDVQAASSSITFFSFDS